MHHTLAAQSNLLTAARAKLGVPFADGGRGTKGYDCCTFIWCCFAEVGVRLPLMPPGHTRMDGQKIHDWMRYHLEETTYAESRAGDIALLKKHRVQHAALVIDHNTVIHCEPRLGSVIEERKTSVWFDNCLFFRVLK